MSYINKISIGNGTHLVEPTLFAVVGGTSAAYTATIDNFELVQGVVVTIKIGNNLTNSANATLNINSTGAKNIIYEGSNVSAGALLAGRIYSMVAINTSNVWTWELLNDLIQIGTSATNAMAGNTNVNNVYQSYKTASSYTYWRPLIIGDSSGSSSSFTPTDKTAQVYTFNTLLVQPSTGTIKAANFDGNASSATAANITSTKNGIAYYSDTSGTFASTSAGSDGYVLIGKGANTAPNWLQATSSNTASTIVQRDSSGNFSAGTIEASLTGHASLDLSLTGGTLTGDLYIDKSSGDTGVFVKNTTRNHQVGLIVGGSSGYGGIYDVTYSKWIVYSDSTGAVGLNGNASTATAIQTAGTTGQFYRGDNTWTDTLSNSSGAQHLLVEGTAESYVRVCNTTTGCYVYLDSAGTGAHGVYSYGYGSSSSSYTQSGKWLICRDANGVTQLPPDITITSANNDGGIYYMGTKARYRMIRFINNTADGNGNGIIIGGGGLTMIGGGESANTVFTGIGSYTGGSEQMLICSDNSIYFYTDQGSGYNTAHYAVLNSNGFSVGSTGDTTCEKDIYVKSGAGNLAMYSAASSTGNRGLWAAAHGTASSGKTFVLIDTNNNISYKANTKGCSWLAGQNDSSKTAILIEDDGTSVNNYFPWIQMTARSTDNKSYWLSIGNYQHQLSILSSITTRTDAGFDYRWCFDPVSGAINSYINAGENGGGFSIYQGSASVVQMRMGQAGTTTQNGTGFLSLGNGVASGTANNAYGYLRLYGTDSNYWNIYGNYAPGATRTLTLPNISGCIATIPTRGTAVGSSSRPVYMSAQGQATAVTYTARTALTLDSTYFQENITTSGKESVYYRLGNLVYVEIHVKAKAAVSTNHTLATGLPIPTVPLYFTLLNTSNNTQLQCLLNSSGIITNQSAITSGHVFYGTLVYILA